MPRAIKIVSAVQTEEGFALVAVLAFILLFAALLLPFASSARLAALTSSHTFEQTRLTRAAEAVNLYIAGKYGSDALITEAFDQASEQQGVSCRIKDLAITFRALDHAGLIDLNVAGQDTIAAGLAAMGLNEGQASGIAQSIVLYRSRQAGAGDADALQPEFGFKRGPIEDTVELLDYPALRQVPPEKLAEFFTVDSRSALVESTFSPPALQPYLPEAAKRSGSRPVRSGTYTLMSRIEHHGETGSDARIIATGHSRGRKSTDLPLGPAPGAANDCSAFLGPELVSWLNRIT